MVFFKYMTKMFFIFPEAGLLTFLKSVNSSSPYIVKFFRSYL